MLSNKSSNSKGTPVQIQNSGIGDVESEFESVLSNNITSSKSNFEELELSDNMKIGDYFFVT